MPAIRAGLVGRTGFTMQVRHRQMRVPRPARLRGLILLGLLLVVGSPAGRPVLAAGASHQVRLNGPPAQGSGALAAYPLNHTLDTTVTAVG
ncbi:MAG TPA: hypothetical protein VFD32_15855, partial [Dehalococcoidia bacterium]|nr:hypothetical protein [Dehalococcoidia bacterium]